MTTIYTSKKKVRNFSEATQEDYDNYFAILENHISELENEISKRVGFAIKLKLDSKKISRGDFYVEFISKDLSEKLDKLTKTFIKKIWIDVYGVFNEKDNSFFIRTHASYEHPKGGSNGQQILWDAVWFDVNSEKFIYGDEIR